MRDPPRTRLRFLPRFRLSGTILVCTLASLFPGASYSADFDDILQIFSGFKTGVGGDFNNDGTTNHLDVFQLALEWRVSIFVTRLVKADPVDGEVGVALTRETILRFSGPLDVSSVTDEAIFASFGGQRLPARLHVSPDHKQVTLFYNDPLPERSRVRVRVNGNLLRDASGERVDVNRDKVPGGIARIDFDTLGVLTLPGTAVNGRVFASERVTAKGTTSEVNVPLEGVLITVDGAESALFAMTDQFGSFTLEPAPVGKFFVHINGLTVSSAMIGGQVVQTSFPDGPYYPVVGKAWRSIAGASDTNVGDIYLPLIRQGSLQAVSQSEDISVSFPDEVVSAHPELTGLSLMVPADSLFADDGTRGGMVGIAPVDPQRLPGELPDGLDFPLVITVQAAPTELTNRAPSNFDVPAPICFPNLPDPNTGYLKGPGETSYLFSFNHDKGIWEAIGPMTVSEDALFVCSDPGVGILAPGWHGDGPPPATGGGDFCEDEGEEEVLFKGPSDDDDDDMAGDDDDDDGGGGAAGACFDCEGNLDVLGECLDICSLIAALETIKLTQYFVRQARVCSLQQGASAQFCLAFLQSTYRQRMVTIRNNWLQCTVSCDKSCPQQDPSPPDDCAGFEDLAACYGACDLAHHNCTLKAGALRQERLLACDLGGTVQGFTDVFECYAAVIDRYQNDISNCNSNLLSCNSNCDSSCPVTFKESISLPQFSLDPEFADKGTFNGLFPFLDPTAAGLIDLVSSTVAILEPFFENPDEIPQDILDLVFDQPAQADQMAGGDAITFLDSAVSDLETEVEMIESSRGILPDNAPRYPILYSASIDRVSQTMDIRGETGPNGEYTLFVPSDGELQFIGFYDPVTHRAGTIAPSRIPGRELILPRFNLAPVVIDQGVVVEEIFTGGFRDTDEDRLADLIEFVYGTDSRDPDSDDDGVFDGAEVEQGTNPLDGRPTRTGIIGTVETPGQAVDVCTENNLAIVADSQSGISVFNVFDAMEPLVIAQVDTPGNAQRVACSGDRIAVADGDGGLHVIDISDPPGAEILGTINTGQAILSVAAAGGLAFGGSSSGQILMVDLESGQLLTLTDIGAPVRDLGIRGQVLYALTDDELYTILPFTSASGGVLASLPSPNPGRLPNVRMFVGDDILYTVFGGGYDTYDITEPMNPLLVAAGGTGRFGWKRIFDNGSGLGIAAVGENSNDTGPHHISVYDVGDASETDVFITQFETPGIARSVSINNALAYVADGARGMHVINYLPYDNMRNPPEISLVANFSLDPPEIEEGKAGIVLADVTDDAQIRNVEFYLDGERAHVDGNYPFELRFVAPRLIDQPTMSLRARATDTGGNATWTPEYILDLTPDVTRPQAFYTVPRPGTYRGEIQLVGAFFSEPIDPETLQNGGLMLFEAGSDGELGTEDDEQVTPDRIEFRTDILGGFLVFSDDLPTGAYRGVLSASISDVAGNSLFAGGEWDFFAVDLTDDGDGDCLSAEVEAALGLNPNRLDSDGDGIFDSDEDSDEDGVGNCQEVFLGLDPGDPDTDGDHLSDGDEIALGTDPLDPDSDDDGYADGEEVELGSDPLDPNSVPFDSGAPIADLVTEAAYLPFAVLNEAIPQQGVPTGELVKEAAHAPFSVLNETIPQGDPVGEAASASFSVENQAR